MGEEAVRELEHTADIGFEVEADSLDGLFRLAARGLVSALGLGGPDADAGEATGPDGGSEATGPDGGAAAAGPDRDAAAAGPDHGAAAAGPDHGERSGTGLTLERPDLERLLVAWLRELLHRSTADGAVPDVRNLEVRGGADDRPPSLEARVLWRPWPRDPVREIKGVTYHGLRVERSGPGWHATVVLDV